MNPEKEIRKRAEELKKDKNFIRKLQKETKNLKGKENIREYIQKAIKLSQKELKK